MSIIIYPLKKTKLDKTELNIENLKVIAHIINWKKFIDYIDGSSITREFIDEFREYLDKHNVTRCFIAKSTHIDVIKMYEEYTNYIGVIGTFGKDTSEEFVKYYKNKIRYWNFLSSEKYKISEKLFEELYPYIKASADKNNNIKSYLYGKADSFYSLILDMIISNDNLSEEFILRHKNIVIETIYKEKYNSVSFSRHDTYKVPTFNFLKVYKDIVDWELLMKKVPLKVFTKKFVVEFYDYIAPLCISIPNIDPKKVNKISQYRRYVKKK